jgi:hypothetical protein
VNALRAAVAVCLVAALAGLPVQAREARRDAVAEAIQRAAQDYRQGRHDAAAAQLEHAARLIREARSAALAAFLPAAPAGWFAAPRSAEAVGAAAPGSAASATRDYLQGERLLSVRILADAPAVQAALQVLGSPAFATVDGARALRIGGQPGMQKYDAVRRSGRITLVVAQRTLVTVEGVDVTAEQLLALTESIDLAGLARLGP